MEPNVHLRAIVIVEDLVISLVVYVSATQTMKMGTGQEDRVPSV